MLSTNIIFLIIGIIIGFIIGFLVSIKRNGKLLGTLKVDRSDLSKDKFQIDIDADLSKLKNGDKCLLKVKEEEIKTEVKSE